MEMTFAIAPWQWHSQSRLVNRTGNRQSRIAVAMATVLAMALAVAVAMALAIATRKSHWKSPIAHRNRNVDCNRNGTRNHNGTRNRDS